MGGDFSTWCDVQISGRGIIALYGIRPANGSLIRTFVLLSIKLCNDARKEHIHRAWIIFYVTLTTTYFGVYFPSWPKLDFLTVIFPLLPNFWLVAWMIFSSVLVFESLSPPSCWLFRRFFDLFLFASSVHTFITVLERKLVVDGEWKREKRSRDELDVEVVATYLVFRVVFPFSHICPQRLLLLFYLYFFAIAFLNWLIEQTCTRSSHNKHIDTRMKQKFQLFILIWKNEGKTKKKKKKNS